MLEVIELSSQLTIGMSTFFVWRNTAYASSVNDVLIDPQLGVNSVRQRRRVMFGCTHRLGAVAAAIVIDASRTHLVGPSMLSHLFGSKQASPTTLYEVAPFTVL
jgi:hypothetical protein